MSERSSIAFSLTGGGAYSRVVASRPPASPPVTKLVFILNWIHWTGGGHSHDRLIFILLGLLPHLELCLSHCHLCPPVDLLIWSIALHFLIWSLCLRWLLLNAQVTHSTDLQTLRHFPASLRCCWPTIHLTDWLTECVRCAQLMSYFLLFLLPLLPSS